ncbi:unnamed protein product [Amoebophrya sp. A25]|nr:unnamed protein product [Amoebophrya sp. A25]|eukprot:GSA25T00015180001.1
MAIDYAYVGELRAQLEEVERRFEHLNMENEMLADYLLRNKASEVETAASPGGGKKAGKSPKQSALTLEEKFRIANGEVETLNKDIETTKKASDQNLDVLKALMEETDIRIAEVKRDAYEFRRDIVLGAENPRTGKTMAERVLKYLEDKLTAKDMLINKLLMKNQALKGSIKKAEGQLKSKEEGGDDLQYIDFHQLQIENQQFVLRIEETNHELIQLKRTYGRTVKMLNTVKKKLSQLQSEAAFFQDETKEQRAAIQKADLDLQRVNDEGDRSKKENKRIKVSLKNSANMQGEMPQVLDYVNQKAEESEVVSQHKNLVKKLELANVAWKKAKTVARQNNLQI